MSNKNSRPTYRSSSPTTVQNEFSLGTAIKTGFGMNIGNKLGDWIFGPSTVETKVVNSHNNCQVYTELLENCMKSDNSDCNSILESLKKCQKN